MFRATTIAVIGVLAAAAASAGSIEIGGASGLTSNYITQGAGAVCAAGAGNCVTGHINSFTEQNYDTTLFASATNGTAPVPFSGYTQTGGEASGLTATSKSNGTTAGGVTFAMIAGDTAGNNAANYWQAGSGLNSMTIPIGVFDVTDVAMMLQNVWGGVNANDTDVTFTFGSTSNATSGLSSITFDLTNSNNNTTTNTGEIRAGVICATVQTATCTFSTTGGGTNPGDSAPAKTTTGVLPANLTVTTSAVFGNSSTFGGTYSYNAGATGFYANTAGMLELDDQDFQFGSTYANMYLVKMTVIEEVGTSGVSETALSAITVDTAATPEPTTILLVFAGLGGIGLARRFRRA